MKQLCYLATLNHSDDVDRRSQRGAWAPQRIRRENIKASLVNLTLNMRYKNDKKYIICHHQIRFFKLKIHRNPFSAGAPPGPRWGSLRRSPRPRSRLGRGIPLPIPLPARRLRCLEVGAYGASALRPPQHEILATPVDVDDRFCVKLQLGLGLPLAVSEDFGELIDHGYRY